MSDTEKEITTVAQNPVRSAGVERGDPHANCKADLAVARARLAEVERERDDLAMREREITCVWCGHEFESTLKSQAEHLYAHAQICEKHPVKKLKDENAALHTSCEAMREALIKAHLCATLRRDGTCDGCHVSAALAAAQETRE